MKKLILSTILLSIFSIAQTLEFESFNFNDESDCAEQLGQQPVSLPYDIINVNHLSKSKGICLQAYTGDNACRKEYHRQKDALGLTSGIRSNHTAEQEAQAKVQCGGWLKSRRSACESFLQQASQICYQLENKSFSGNWSATCLGAPGWWGTGGSFYSQLSLTTSGKTISGTIKSNNSSTNINGSFTGNNALLNAGWGSEHSIVLSDNGNVLVDNWCNKDGGCAVCTYQKQ